MRFAGSLSLLLFSFNLRFVIPKHGALFHRPVYSTRFLLFCFKFTLIVLMLSSCDHTCKEGIPILSQWGSNLFSTKSWFIHPGLQATSNGSRTYVLQLKFVNWLSSLLPTALCYESSASLREQISQYIYLVGDGGVAGGCRVLPRALWGYACLYCLELQNHLI